MPENKKPAVAGFLSRTWKKYGADEGSRTPDLLITNQLLYQLSYVGEEARSIKKRRGRDNARRSVRRAYPQDHVEPHHGCTVRKVRHAEDLELIAR